MVKVLASCILAEIKICTCIIKYMCIIDYNYVRFMPFEAKVFSLSGSHYSSPSLDVMGGA